MSCRSSPSLTPCWRAVRYCTCGALCALFGDPCGPPALAGACSGLGQAGDNMGDLPGRIPRMRCRAATRRPLGVPAGSPSRLSPNRSEPPKITAPPSPAGRQAAMASYATCARVAEAASGYCVAPDAYGGSRCAATEREELCSLRHLPLTSWQSGVGRQGYVCQITE